MRAKASLLGQKSYDKSFTKERYFARDQSIPGNHHRDVLQRSCAAALSREIRRYFEAVVAIDTGEVVEGRLPPRVLGLVQEWREYHRTELKEDWDLARERKALKRIDPLE
jgi:hypothetical protein